MCAYDPHRGSERNYGYLPPASPHSSYQQNFPPLGGAQPPPQRRPALFGRGSTSAPQYVQVQPQQPRYQQQTPQQHYYPSQQQQQRPSLFGHRAAGRPLPSAAARFAARRSPPAAAPPPSISLGTVEEYVKRAYASCRSAPERDWMEEQLKQEILRAQESGLFSSRDWSTYRVPVCPSRYQPPAYQQPQQWRASPVSQKKSKKQRNLEKQQHLRQYQYTNPALLPTPPQKLSKKERKKARKAQKHTQWQQQQQQQRMHQAPMSAKEEALKRKREQRFAADSRQVRKQARPQVGEWEASIALATGDWEKLRVVGTSQELEKSYVRLTEAPDPRDVRPLKVLKRAHRRLADGEFEYEYLCEQLKSIRQDMRIQGIQNAFTVEVYEWHARLAILNEDLHEYNACQTQLRVLYSSVHSVHEMEFCAYRLLYFALGRNESEQAAAISELSPHQRSNALVIHAIDVLNAVNTGNYHHFRALFARRNRAQLAPAFMRAISQKWFKDHATRIMKAAYGKTFDPDSFEWWSE